jgi:hypothetical protein
LISLRETGTGLGNLGNSGQGVTSISTRTKNSAINAVYPGTKPRSVTRSGNKERLILPIARHLACNVSLPMREDAEALYELVLERRRLIRRLDELNEILFEIDMRAIEPTLRGSSSVVH